MTGHGPTLLAMAAISSTTNMPGPEMIGHGLTQATVGHGRPWPASSRPRPASYRRPRGCFLFASYCRSMSGLVTIPSLRCSALVFASYCGSMSGLVTIPCLRCSALVLAWSLLHLIIDHCWLGSRAIPPTQVTSSNSLKKDLMIFAHRTCLEPEK